MKRYIRVWALALLFGFRCLQAVAPLCAQESNYQGRTFAEWRQDLRSAQPMIRERAIDALFHFGEPAVPLLTEAVADPDFNVRTLAMFSLGRLGPKAKAALPVLVQTFADRDQTVRLYAVGALRLMGVSAAEAAPDVVRMAVADPSPEVRRMAVDALRNMGASVKEATDRLLQQFATTDTDEAVRNRATELLRDSEAR
jgi:HEAT repeat protein